MSFLAPAGAASWIEAPEGSDFPIQNLPFGIVRFAGLYELATRVGESVVLISPLVRAGRIIWDEERLRGERPDQLHVDPAELSQLREELFGLLSTESGGLDAALRTRCLLPVSAAQMAVPETSAFVDFYSGIHHASNVGRMFRPDQPPLLPNYRHLPVGYSGRASSLVPSGTPILRPKGQTMPPGAPAPIYGPTKELDFELEMGFYLGAGTSMGETLSVAEAESKIIGFALVNDWSARDVQRWEYQPLGPFLAKSFATSISPWLVTLDALEPFRVQGPTQEPEPLPHLRQSGPGHFDIALEALLRTAKASRPQLISRTNFRELYWSPAQQLAHMASNGAPLEPGDLYASGTISGPEPGSFGSMLELAWGGAQPIQIEETGERRAFLEDGDVVIFRGFCEKEGLRLGFGELSAQALPCQPPR